MHIDAGATKHVSHDSHTDLTDQGILTPVHVHTLSVEHGQWLLRGSLTHRGTVAQQTTVAKLLSQNNLHQSTPVLDLRVRPSVFRRFQYSYVLISSSGATISGFSPGRGLIMRIYPRASTS